MASASPFQLAFDPAKLAPAAYQGLQAIQASPLAGYIKGPVGGYENRKIAGTTKVSDHATGHALDLHVTPRSLEGWSVAKSAATLPGAKYIIYNGMIADRASGWQWKPYSHPSGKYTPTLNHEDHVHVSFSDNAPITRQTVTAAPSQLSAGVARYATLAQQAEAKYGLPAGLVSAVMQQESRGNPTAKSPVGAAGLMQLMPATAKSLGVTNVNDPAQSIDAGARYLATQYKKYGRVDLALAAYNAGPGNVNKYGGVPPFKETQNYVRTIMGHMGSGAASTNAQFDPAVVGQGVSAKLKAQGLDPAGYSFYVQGGQVVVVPKKA